MGNLLSIIIFLPLLGAVAIALFIKKENYTAIKWTALVFAIVDFLVSLPLFFGFAIGTHEMQFVEKYDWIPALGISYYVGIDGINLLLVILTAFLSALCVLAAWKGIVKGVKGFFISLLLLETGMLGVFCALDLFLFYIFWEGMLIPMYFIIGIWGGENRIYATFKFVLYTMAGSALMLVGIIYLYFYNGGSFDLMNLYATVNANPIAARPQFWLFLAFFVAFAIKVPLFPFHTWLPDAHVEAPTVGSVILAGVLLKMGTYGLVRFCLPLFPQASVEFMPFIAVLSLIGIIYGALVAMVQPDLKKLIAYSSVSHLGFVVLGSFAMTHQGLEGGILQMINHGLSTGALFLIVGMIYERRHTRMIADFGGLSRQIPIFATCFMIVTLSSIGLPGLNGFIGEFLVLIGTFVSDMPYAKLYAVLGAIGVILAAVYMLWMFQRVMFGELKNPENQKIADLSGRELAIMLPIIALIFWIGFYPKPLLTRMEASVEYVISQTKSVQPSAISFK